jgi:hypothetical protein
MMQSSGGGNPMNAAQIARLQQQLAQYGRANPGQQQQMMNPNMGGMANPQQQQQQQQQQLQQAYMQQQQQLQQTQQNQHPQGGMPQVRRNSQLAGMNNNSATALAMMQQQQQQVAAGNSQMANANMSSYWNALQNQNSGGAMDASSASSAQLAALAGMNMGGNNVPAGQNNAANILLGNRTSQTQGQPQAQGMGGNQQVQQGMGQTTDATLLQQQIAQLQRQLQQQQQQQPAQQQPQQNQAMGMQAGGMDRRASNSSGSFPMQQQQLFQQMQQQMASGMIGQDAQQAMGMAAQQQKSMGNDQFSNMAAMMQGQNVSAQQMQSMQQNLRNSMSGGNAQAMMAQGARGGTLNEQDLLLQQQQLLRNSGMSQSMQNDATKAQEMFLMNQQGNQGNSQADLMGQRRTSLQGMDPMGASINAQSQNAQSQNAQSQNAQSQNAQSQNAQSQSAMNASFNNVSPFDMDNSISSQRSNHQQNKANRINPTLDVSAGQLPGDKPDDPASNQKSFLDGSFAGGWQSNADLPDRRRIIFSILEVIRQMRPDTNKISQK